MAIKIDPEDFGKQTYKDSSLSTKGKNTSCNERLQVAAMALQGALSNQSFLNNVCTGLTTAEDIYARVASMCVNYADALIAEVNKEKE